MFTYNNRELKERKKKERIYNDFKGVRNVTFFFRTKKNNKNEGGVEKMLLIILRYSLKLESIYPYLQGHDG